MIHGERSAKWHDRFMRLAKEVSTWSKDPKTKVGCVIVDDKRRVISVGYNGFPRGVPDDEHLLNDREDKLARVVHAELNAILSAGNPMRLEGATLYCSLYPCNECAKSIIQSGIAVIIAPYPGNGEWSDAWAISDQMFTDSGVDQVLL